MHEDETFASSPFIYHSSSLGLVVVSPLGLCSQNTTVGNAVVRVRFHLKELIGGPEQAAVLSAAVTNNNL